MERVPAAGHPARAETEYRHSLAGAMSLNRQLIVTGFNDLERANRFLSASELDGIDPQLLLEGFAVSADPDLALVSLVRLLARSPQLADLVNGGGRRSEALFPLLGAPQAPAGFLLRRPEHLDVLDVRVSPEPAGVPAEQLRRSLLASVGADPEAVQPVAAAAGPEAWTALRATYRRHLAELAIRDLGAASPEDFM